MVKIILNAGHGAGKAHNRGGLYYNEGDNNFLYSLVLKKEIETYDGVIVDLVRNKNEHNPPLDSRHKFGAGYDLFLSLHSNATSDASVRGTEIIDSIEKPNTALAKVLCNDTAELFNHNNRGVKYKEGQKGYNWYSELRFNQAKSAMILESGFHTNHDDCLFFKENHERLAEVHARAIASFYGLRKKQIIIPKDHWAESAFQSLLSKGVVINDKRFDDPITRGEVIALLDRVIDVLLKNRG